MVALSAKGVTGARKTLRTTESSRIGANVRIQGNAQYVTAPITRARLITKRCRRVLSASLVHNGTLMSVIRGPSPVRTPICAPVK